VNGLHSQSAHREVALVNALGLAPLGWFSGAVGWMSRRRVPRPLRAPLYGAFARVYDVALDEAELPLDGYASFGDFFARRLRDGARSTGGGPGDVVAPADGKLAARGVAEAGHLIQAKGQDYLLADLLADPALADELEGGLYLTFYLSPRDYHRVHSPVDGRLVGYDWVPGVHLPVSPRAVRRVPGVFARNERVILRLETEAGPVAVVMVAATGVANISVTAAGIDSRQLRRTRRVHRVRFDRGVPVARGDELGAFHLGSTVILVMPAGAAALLPEDEGMTRPIRVGEVVAGRQAAARAAEMRA